MNDYNAHGMGEDDCHDDDYFEDYDECYEDDNFGGSVSFIRPDGDDEGKDVQWFLNHCDFFEVEDGVWSGDW